MRYRQPFIVYPRSMPSGQKIFYYQTYDQNGNRTVPQSTGKLTQTAAKAHCMKLWKEEKLVPTSQEKKASLFHEFAEKFWVHGESAYLKYREQRGYKISLGHAVKQNRYFHRYIDPAFGNSRMD